MATARHRRRRPAPQSGGQPRSEAGRQPVLLPSAFSGPWRQVVPFFLLITLLAVCALGGGSSFANVYSLLYVRPIALVCLIAALLVPAAAEWRTYRAPIVLLGLFALLMAIQLVPLPPSLWTMLPGRAPYAGIAALAGIDQPLRPISLTPDLTWNSLVALIVPAAVLAAFVKLRADQRRAMIPVLIALCVMSATLGVAQLAGGERSALYWYERTYPGFPVGFLANRNHHAVLLALIFPALRVWTLMPTPDRAWRQRRQWLALGLGVLILPIILATGSRAGMAATLLGIVGAFALFPARDRGRMERAVEGPGSFLASARWRGALRLSVPLALILLVGLTYMFGRAASIDRFLTLSAIDADQRFLYAPVVLQIVADSFPVGTGFGSFDPVFRQYEPDAILKNSYFNHAHNELFELALMAGAAGLLLLGALLSWWALRMLATLRGGNPVGSEAYIARLGGVIVALMLLASLFDYPLRAPLMAAVFALACCWLCERKENSGA